MKVFFKFFLSLSLFYLLMFHVPCSMLHVSAEQIDKFTATYNINKDGSILVNESLEYNFGSLNKHGIYRNIPFLKTNQEGKKFKLDFQIQTIVDENNQPYQYSVSTENNNLKIKIGSADKFVTGVKTYQLKYLVSGALTYFSDHDELYWNVTGNEWTVPIYNASAAINFPETLAIDKFKLICYTGVQGSKEQNCTPNISVDNISAVNNAVLPAGSGLTIVFGFPKNIVTTLEPESYTAFYDTLFGKIITALFVLIVALVFLSWFVFYPLYLPIKWFLSGRDPKTNAGQLTASFDPPQTKNRRKLTPIETGTLVDEKIDNRDLFATIVDLARRGYFKIVEKKKSDFSFVKQKEFASDNNLQNFELILLNKLFKGGRSEFKLKDHYLYDEVPKIKTAVFDGLVSGGFFPKSPEKIRLFYYIIIGVALFTGNFFLAIMAAIFGLRMPKKTLYGTEQKNLGLSLKNFLSSQERQLEFQAKNQMFFEKLLPFAIAFGVEKIWANRFKDLTMKPPEWFESYDSDTFTTAYLLSHLNSSMHSFGSTLVTPTSSSSGFSSGFSGGSSGGGGGGGGGGSW